MSPAAAAEKFAHEVIAAAKENDGVARETEVTRIANWFLARRLLIDTDRLGRILDDDGCRNPKTQFRALKWAKASNAEVECPTAHSAFQSPRK